MEGCQIARIHARDNRLGSRFAKCFGHDFQLAQVVSFADFHKGLHIKRCSSLCHAHELFVIKNAGNQEHSIGTATICDIDFIFEQKKIFAKHGACMQALLAAAFHQVRHGNQVAQRSLEKIRFGKHRNRLRVSLGISRRKPHRIQIRRDIALRRRCSLDFENRTCITEKFGMAHLALFRNVNSKIQAKPLDILAAHPYDFR